MLERVDFAEKQMGKDEYKEVYGGLMEQLVVLQQQARNAGVGLVVLFEGWNGAGKGSRISDLMYNLDARATSGCVPPDVDEDEARAFVENGMGVSGFYPFMQGYWKALGERGTITFYDRGWYAEATQYMLVQHPDDPSFTAKSARRFSASIHDFEQQLALDGYVVVKFFLHVSESAQRKRLERLHNDPATRWRVPDHKLASAESYEESYALYDELLESSNFDFAPWTLINGEDKRRANVTIARTLIASIERELARKADATAVKDTLVAAKKAKQASEEHDYEAAAAMQQALSPTFSRFHIESDYPRGDAIDHTLSLDREAYKSELKSLQKELFRLENIMYQRRVPLMIVYEGWDAAGKGGNIKRVAQALDARSYTIFPSPAPTPTELAHPHLWRYWTRLPKAGHVGMYDRSWYGRVLVERVENLATPDEWSRAYDEINAFERDMVDWGAILLKFWVDVSPEMQLERFNDRTADPAKQWKITPDDWRNREKYPLYKAAIDDMFRLTSTTIAPWHILESDDKRYARVKGLRIIVEALRARLEP